MSGLDYSTQLWDSNSVLELRTVDWRLACIITAAAKAFLLERRKQEPVLAHKVRVTQGYRSPDQQADMVKHGASKTMRSHHLIGMAVDLAYIRAGKARWELHWYEKLDHHVQKAVLSFGLDNNDVVWGGHWTTLRDGVHWQLMLPPLPGWYAVN